MPDINVVRHGGRLLALHAVVMQAWVEGVSTRKVDDLVAGAGRGVGISKSEVSRICAQLDGEVAA